MALWVDKYRPKDLSSLTYHLDQAKDLANIVKVGDFPHLLVYGPSGAGKATRIMCILKELYGNGVEKLRLDHKSFQVPSGKKLEIETFSSNYHIQLNPGTVGNYDRVVVQEVIKQMAQMQQIDNILQQPFKMVVLMEADQLTRDAQDALRRTMEKYSSTCRLILCCESIARIIDPLRSRCMAIRVASPSDNDIKLAIHKVCKSENIKIPDSLLTSVVDKANGNLRRALLMLEAAKTQCYPFKENQNIPDPDWEIYLRETARIILQQQTCENLLKVRNRLYECLSRCIPPSLVFVKLLDDLLQGCDEVIKPSIVACAAEFEHRLVCSSKAIFHLEAFIAAFMNIYYRHKNADN
ncbi:unnamed protein product [Dracunculus medinensis]|uniref:Replication factor C subunit 3 n=1 Tax=Dracunculus medinensis TaxID=318479 RepID=A0A0N4UKS1_DRAME|nr:unnamed protein product [Dracunculus medinensis]